VFFRVLKLESNVTNWELLVGSAGSIFGARC
jgi:hypothetical protein